MKSWWPVIAPVAALAVNVLVQVGACRASRGSHFLRSVALGFFAGVLVLIAAQILIPPASTFIEACWLIAGVNLPLYACLSYCFFNFANLGQSSIRVRIYNEIATRPDGVPIADLAAKYNEDALMQMRLARLIESGDLVQNGQRYYIGRSRLVPIAKVIFWLKQFVLGRSSEFEK